MEFNPKNVRHNVGDKVVALTSNSSPRSQTRVAGQTYVVKDVTYCQKCGMQAINIGQSTYIPFIDCTCGHEQPTRGKHWTDSPLFAPLQEIDNLMASAIETENYEMAEVLKKAQPLRQPDEQEN